MNSYAEKNRQLFERVGEPSVPNTLLHKRHERRNHIMKDELTNEAYEALSKYRQSRAYEKLEEVDELYPKAQKFIEEVDALLEK